MVIVIVLSVMIFSVILSCCSIRSVISNDNGIEIIEINVDLIFFKNKRIIIIVKIVLKMVLFNIVLIDCVIGFVILSVVL